MSRPQTARGRNRPTTEYTESAPPSPNKHPVRPEVYSRDIDRFQYTDALKWNRFQIASAIEAAVLYALYATTGLPDLERFGLVVFATVLIGLLGALAWADEKVCDAFDKRIREYEEQELRISFDLPRRRGWGRWIVRIAMVAIGLFNLVLVVKFGLELRPAT